MVPPLEYMLALKLEAMRINDPANGATENDDIRYLLRADTIASIDEPITVLANVFSRSANPHDAQRFLLTHVWPGQEVLENTPRYPRRLR